MIIREKLCRMFVSKSIMDLGRSLYTAQTCGICMVYTRKYIRLVYTVNIQCIYAVHGRHITVPYINPPYIHRICMQLICANYTRRIHIYIYMYTQAVCRPNILGIYVIYLRSICKAYDKDGASTRRVYTAYTWRIYMSYLTSAYVRVYIHTACDQEAKPLQEFESAAPKVQEA